MEMTDISPDQTVFWQYGFAKINATIAYTWGVMLLLVVVAWLVTRNLTADREVSRGQNLLEILVSGMKSQIEDVAQEPAGRYLAFIGTLFLFIFVSNVLSVVPGFTPPTASLSTTAALAACVFVAVPVYGIASRGLGDYLRQYARPTPIMLPFNIIGELSRTLALAVRLFGNIMSGTKIVMILLAIVPLIFPVVMNLLGLLTGVIQAYIFAILAMVYISSATRARREKEREAQNPEQEGE